jgi:integral membrane protein
MSADVTADVHDPRMLRLVSLLEGASFMVLLFIAMPLKYGFEQPEMVRWTGSIHGALFVWCCIALADHALAARWKLRRFVWSVFLVTVPFGAFRLHHELKATR